MSDYISREAALKAAEHAYGEWNLAMAAADGQRQINRCFKMQELCKAVASVFEDAPAADVEPVRYGRLRELADADRDGRLVVLPCKVGDVVYGFHGEKTILPMVAKWIETNTDGWCIAAQYVPMAPRFYRFSDFGKTVFLTREEAEKALEAMKDG